MFASRRLHSPVNDLEVRSFSPICRRPGRSWAGGHQSSSPRRLSRAHREERHALALLLQAAAANRVVKVSFSLSVALLPSVVVVVAVVVVVVMAQDRLDAAAGDAAASSLLLEEEE